MDQESSVGQQDLKLCDNCKKEVSAVNFLMHTVHCHRNITLCEICDEPFPKNEIDAHIAEAHAKICCIKCGEEVEQKEVKTHDELNCAKRLVKCGFCGMDVQASEQTEHENYCGSRTERCAICGQYVMVKYLDIHNSSNHLFLSIEDLDRQPAKSNTQISMSAFSGLKNFNNIRDGKESLSRPSVSSGKRTNDMPQINVSVKHEKQKEANKPILQDLYESSRHTDSSASLSLEQLDRLLAMHMAEEEENFQPLYAHSELDDHYGRTTMMPASTNVFLPTMEDYDDVLPVVGESHSGHTNYRNAGGVNATTSAHLDRVNSLEYHPVIRAPVPAEEGTSCLPCEFCNELFPADHLLDHQNYCQLGSVRRHPARHLEESNLDLPEFNNSKNLENLREEPAVFNNLIKSSNSEPLTTSDFDAVMIPCEYCGAQFEADYIILHQSGCSGLPDEPSTHQFSADKQSSPTVSPKLKEEPQTNQKTPLKHQSDPDMEYLDELFLKEAIENSLKDKNLAEFEEELPDEGDEQIQTSMLANLSLKSPTVRHVPIRVSPDYGIKNRLGIENAENNIREAKAHHANRGSPLVHKTVYDAPVDERLSAFYSNNVTSSRLQKVERTGARPKSFVSRTSNEFPADATIVSRPENPLYPTVEEMQNNVSGAMQGKASISPRMVRRSLCEERDAIVSNGVQQSPTKPVPPRRSRQQHSQY